MPSGERRYRLLAQMLASLVAGLAGDPALTAERAGREWGGYLTEPPPPYQQPSAGDALAELMRLLASIGFAPQVQPGKPRTRRNCCCASARSVRWPGSIRRSSARCTSA